jgi:hypothetical protein
MSWRVATCFSGGSCSQTVFKFFFTTEQHHHSDFSSLHAVTRCCRLLLDMRLDETIYTTLKPCVPEAETFDIMAEVLGVVASSMGIASLAIQLGDIVLRWKNIWHTIKDAPEEVKYFIEEVEALGLFLREKVPDKSLSPSDSLSRSVEITQRLTTLLSSILVELDQAIAKRKIRGGVKVALKQGTINKLRDRLRSAQFLLMLSYQAYLE